MQNNKFVLVLDSSQIATFLECPEQWNLSYKERLTSLGPQDTTAMDAGTYGHKLLDIYYRIKSANPGTQLNSILEACYAYNPDVDTCECGCDAGMHQPIQALGIQECQRCKHCLKFRPKPFPLSQDVRSQVRNRFKDYVYKYQANDFVAHSPEHVEVGFSEHIFEDDENLFVLEGRIDLLGTLQGLSCLVDHKYQMSTHYLYPKSIQFKNYALVARQTLLVINYIRLGKSYKDNFLERVLVNFTVPELLAWKQKLIKIYFNIKNSIVNSNFEQQWNACKGYGKTYSLNEPKYCPYTQLCEENDPQMRELRKEKLYHIKEAVWKPW